MQRPGIRAGPPYQEKRPLKQFQEIVGFILRIFCAIFFIVLIHVNFSQTSFVSQMKVLYHKRKHD